MCLPVLLVLLRMTVTPVFQIIILLKTSRPVLPALLDSSTAAQHASLAILLVPLVLLALPPVAIAAMLATT